MEHKKDTGKSMKMHHAYFGIPKGTSQAEVTSNSEKIKPIVLAGITSGSQTVSK